jgi:hypothetical protein
MFSRFRVYHLVKSLIYISNTSHKLVPASRLETWVFCWLLLLGADLHLSSCGHAPQIHDYVPVVLNYHCDLESCSRILWVPLDTRCWAISWYFPCSVGVHWVAICSF